MAVAGIGCGGGVLSESMARKGATVTGIDLGEKALKVADLHSLESGVQVRYKLIAAEEMAEQEAGQHQHGEAADHVVRQPAIHGGEDGDGGDRQVDRHRQGADLVLHGGLPPAWPS